MGPGSGGVGRGKRLAPQGVLAGLSIQEMCVVLGEGVVDVFPEEEAQEEVGQGGGVTDVSQMGASWHWRCVVSECSLSHPPPPSSSLLHPPPHTPGPHPPAPSQPPSLPIIVSLSLSLPLTLFITSLFLSLSLSLSVCLFLSPSPLALSLASYLSLSLVSGLWSLSRSLPVSLVSLSPLCVSLSLSRPSVSLSPLCVSLSLSLSLAPLSLSRPSVSLSPLCLSLPSVSLSSLSLSLSLSRVRVCVCVSMRVCEIKHNIHETYTCTFREQRAWFALSRAEGR